MNNKPLLEAEDLVRAISDCPSLSEGLRSRILAEAVVARSLDRSHQKRERLITSCGLSLLVGLAVWTQSMLFFSHVSSVKQKMEVSEARQSAPKTPVTDISEKAEGLSALMAMSQVGEWEHVDAVTHLRKMNRQAFRGFAGL